MANGQLWEIDSQGNKKQISGMVTGELPKYTMAEYTALTNKPINWICTDYDATSEYGINATEVKYDNDNSVKDKIDAIGGTMYSKVVSATTDSNGNITSDLLASQYIYVGTTGAVSLFFIPLNALSDGKIRIRVLDATNMNPAVGVAINQTFYFWKIG